MADGDNVKLMHRGVGPSIRTWTLEVCQGCGKPHGPHDRWGSCPAPGFSHSSGGDLHDTEQVEVVEADPVLWARDASQASAKKWRDAHDTLCDALERIIDGTEPDHGGGPGAGTHLYLHKEDMQRIAREALMRVGALSDDGASR